MRNNNNRNKSHGRRGGPRRGGGRGNNNEQSLGKQKSHATNQKERYLNMARDAQSNGERVDAEFYYQHVEHYSRILNDIAEKEAERNAAREAQQAERKAEADAEDASDDAAQDVSSEETDTADEKPKPKRTRGPRKPKAEAEEIPLPEGVVPAAAGDEATA